MQKLENINRGDQKVLFILYITLTAIFYYQFIKINVDIIKPSSVLENNAECLYKEYINNKLFGL